MNQNTPNPWLDLWWPHPCPLPIEWGSRGCPSNVNLRPRVVLDIQVWLQARDGDERNHLLAVAFMTNFRGEHMIKTLEETETSQHIPSSICPEKPEGTDTVHLQFPHAFSGILVCGSEGSPSYWNWSLIN